MSRRAPSTSGGFNPNLRLDREVYAIVQTLDNQEEGRKAAAKMTVSVVYDVIKRSNSSVARQKKKVLEESIERVLEVRQKQMKGDENGEDSDAEIERLEEERERDRREARDASLLNRQIAKGWGFSRGEGPKGEDRPSNDNGTPIDENNRPQNISNRPTNDHQMPTSDSATPQNIENRPQTINGTPHTIIGTPKDGNNMPKDSRDRHANGEPRSKKRKGTPKEVDRTPPTGISIRDIAGVDDTLERLMQEVWFPLNAGEACEKMGYRYGNGVLLHGPSGCGKTTLAHAVAGSAGAAFIPISAPSIVGGTSGESEKNIRDVFDEAIRIAPCLIFFDEIDAIAGKRESANKGMEGRIVAEIMNGMDRIKRNTPLGKNVVVLAATNRPESLDPAIRRRFGSEIDMGMPSEKAREQILRSLSRDLNLADDVNFKELAKLTPGYVGSDLQYVVTAAVSESFSGSLKQLLEKARSLRTSDEDAGELSKAQQNWLLLEDHRQASWGEAQISNEQFKTAISRVQPASKREGFSTIPDTTWANVGALGDVRKKLEMSIIGPIKDPELFNAVGIKPAAGILLWGPPGCGKTLVAKAVANESKANFISIKGPELLNKYVGESERAVRQLFSRAKSSAPCILFFDEMDALVPKRDDSLSDASARVVNTLLTELDGVGDRSGIYVIGATNRPDIIDEAIRRPGRLGTSIYVGLPGPEDRIDILKTLYRNTITRQQQQQKEQDKAASAVSEAMDVDNEAVAEEEQEEEADLTQVALDPRCEGFSGADLGNLMQAAAQACLERAYTLKLQQMGQHATAKNGQAGKLKKPVITKEDWEKALTEVKPSVKDADKYAMIE